MYIRGRGKIGYLIGDTKEATKTDLSYAAWDAENSMIMTRLVNSIEDEICLNYMCYPTTKALWDIIKMHSNLRNQSQIYELQLKLGDICQGENSIPNILMCLRVYGRILIYSMTMNGKLRMIVTILRRW